MALSLFLSCYWILEYLGIFFFSFQKTYWIRARLSTAGLIHLTRNADLVAAINGDLWAEMEKLLYFSIIVHLHAPAPPTIQGCGWMLKQVLWCQDPESPLSRYPSLPDQPTNFSVPWHLQHRELQYTEKACKDDYKSEWYSSCDDCYSFMFSRFSFTV